MKKFIFISLCAGFLCSCTSSQQIQANANAAFQKENEIWASMGKRAATECPKEVSRKTQMARQDCLESLIRQDVQPHVSYPRLVDYMLEKTRAEAQNYADGKINKATYTKNVNGITADYWNYWWKPWSSKIDASNSSGSVGLGNVLLLGIQTTGQVLQDHQQAAKVNAEKNRPVQCTMYGSTATCY